MYKHLKFLFCIVVVMGLILTACAPAATEAPAAEEPAAEEPAAEEPAAEEPAMRKSLLRKSLLRKAKSRLQWLIPGVVSDQSWNQFGYEGLVRAEEECNVEIAYSEDVFQDEQLGDLPQLRSRGL